MIESLQGIPAATVALLSRHQLLRNLVQRQLIAEAVSEEVVSAEDLEKAKTLFLQQNRLASEGELTSYLQSQGLSQADLVWQISLPLRIRQHCLTHYLDKAEARFLSRKKQLDQVVYSLVRVQDGMLARELYLRILDGEATFAEVAAQYSEGPEKASHGIIGPKPMNQAHPILAEKLMSSEPRHLLEPFPIEQWWLVARLEQFVPAIFSNAIAEQMAMELFDESIQQELTRNMAELFATPVPAR
ncbi:MAG: peptidylprolyl isomerase [Synechococcaceae cyanobacterium ELA263]